MKIECRKNHSGNRHLTRHKGGWECDGCGTHYVELIVTSKLGMTPYATESSMREARKSAKAARQLGLDGAIIPN